MNIKIIVLYLELLLKKHCNIVVKINNNEYLYSGKTIKEKIVIENVKSWNAETQIYTILKYIYIIMIIRRNFCQKK